MASRKKLQLPKSVLEMKFMKKTKERLEKELDNTAGHGDLYSNVITSEMRQATGNYIAESSFIFCEDLIEGRLSFKGMNPEIEKIMESEIINHSNGEMQKDVSDEVLARKMSKFNKRKMPSSPSQFNVPISKKKK